MRCTKSFLIAAAAATVVFAGKGPCKSDLRLVYFDGHMHTVESDGSGTVEDVKTTALERGLQAVIVTNHTKQLTLAEWKDLNRRAKALSDTGFLMLNAFEVTGSEGLLNRDHVLAWGVRDPFVGDDSLELAPEEVWESPNNPAGTGALYPENIAKWVDYIHQNGGIAVHAHTSGNTNPLYGVDYIEVFNLSHVKDVAFYASMMGYPASDGWNLGLVLNNMAVYGERDLNMPVTLPGMSTPLPLKYALYQATLMLTGVGQWLGAPAEPLHSWDELLMDYVTGQIPYPVFGVANTDAHNTYNITGRVFTGGSSDTQGDRSHDDSDVGEVKNGVLVKSLTRHHLLNAIKAGRLFATTGPSLSFTVNGRPMGSTVKFRPNKERRPAISLSVNSPSPSSVLAGITIVKNGQTWRTLNPMAPAFQTEILDDATPVDGYYRVEVVAVDVLTGAYSFAYANPVFTKVVTACESDEDDVAADGDDDSQE